jgi:hypothetical protein
LRASRYASGDGLGNEVELELEAQVEAALFVENEVAGVAEVFTDGGLDGLAGAAGVVGGIGGQDLFGDALMMMMSFICSCRNKI